MGRRCSGGSAVEEAQGGEAPRGGSSRPRAEGRLGAGGGGEDARAGGGGGGGKF
jgi:hypothetical protein